MKGVKTMGKNNSTSSKEQDQQAKTNKVKKTSYGMTGEVDKRMDGPNRPAE
jgi:hypothetical protein